MADNNLFSCSPLPQEEDQETPDADECLLTEVSPRVATPELPQFCSSIIRASDNSEPNLAASPAKPRSESTVSKEQRPPHEKFTSSPYWQDHADATSGPVTRFCPQELHAAAISTENYGDDGDGLAPALPSFSESIMAERPLRGSSKKRSARQDRFLPVTRKIEGEVNVASKYPRLVSVVLFHPK